MTPVPGLRPVAFALTAAMLITGVLAGCKHAEEPGAHVAGWTMIDPSQRHPIMVSQEPATMSVRVARGSLGLSPAQRAQIAGFLEHYRRTDSGNSKLVIAVPSGSANETAAVHAVAEMRYLISDFGFSDNAVVLEPYAARDPSAAIRFSYLRYVAEGPACGNWPTNLADDRRNLPYANFGCAQQHNLAAQVANPADLLGPRTMDPSDADRRTASYAKYRKGESTVSQKSGEERSQVKGAQ